MFISSKWNYELGCPDSVSIVDEADNWTMMTLNSDGTYTITSCFDSDVQTSSKTYKLGEAWLELGIMIGLI